MESETSKESDLQAGTANCKEYKPPDDLYQYLCTNNFNTRNICRICLAIDSKEMYPLFSSKNASILANMYTALTSIQVTSDDGLPQQMCSICQNLIVQFQEFKVKCETAYHTLKTLLKRDIDIEKDHTSSSKGKRKAKMEVKVKKEIDSDETVHVVEPKGIRKSGRKKKLVIAEPDSLSLLKIKTSKKRKMSSATENYITVFDDNILEKSINIDEESNLEVPMTSYDCPVCAQNFAIMSLWKEHMKKEHAYTEQNSCDYKCSEFFGSEHDFKLHLSLHKKGPVWRCTDCNKHYTERRKLRSHLRVHKTTVEDFSCEICSKKFCRADYLRKHKQSHNRVKNLKCHLCGKRFALAPNLTLHLRRHNGVKPYKCDKCEKSFATRYALRNHGSVHTKARPYECTYCGKVFSCSTYRNAHVRLHTGKGYSCEICGKAFPKNSQLKIHMDRKHKGDPTSPENTSKSTTTTTNETSSPQNETTSEKSVREGRTTFDLTIVKKEVDSDDTDLVKPTKLTSAANKESAANEPDSSQNQNFSEKVIIKEEFEVNIVKEEIDVDEDLIQPTDSNHYGNQHEVFITVPPLVPIEGSEEKEVHTQHEMVKQEQIDIENQRVIPVLNSQHLHKYLENQKKIKTFALELARKKAIAESSKKYRERVKLKKQNPNPEDDSEMSYNEESSAAKRKLSAERSKRYRDRLKTKKFDNSSNPDPLSSEEDSSQM